MLSRQSRTTADASSMRLSAPKAISDRLVAAIPEPIATAFDPFPDIHLTARESSRLPVSEWAFYET
jgi:hypothetical protein